MDWKLAVLIVILIGCLCGCTAQSQHPSKIPSKINAEVNAVVMKCENGSKNWCLYVTLTLPQECMVEYRGVKILGDSVNVYFSCSNCISCVNCQRNHSTQGDYRHGEKSCEITEAIKIKNYSKKVMLPVRGEYTLNIYVNGKLKSSFHIRIPPG